MRTALLCAALVCSACTASQSTGEAAPPSAKPASEAGKTLYDRLGGKGAIEAVIDDFLGRVAQDERINAPFAGAHLPRLRQRLVEQVCQASGGPCVYSGRDMKTVHAGMGVTGAQFDALVGHLVASLDRFKVPEREKGELLSVLGPMKADIVEEP
jgi:hemoglobin